MIFVLASQFHNKKALVWAFSVIVSENRWIDCSSTHNPLPGNCIMELLGPGSWVTQQEEEREAAALICRLLGEQKRRYAFKYG